MTELLVISYCVTGIYYSMKRTRIINSSGTATLAIRKTKD